MRVIERRFDVELISPDALVQYMRFRDNMSLKQLADAVTRMGVKTSKATIGHLTSGHVKRTNVERAKAIAKVLNAPVHALFAEPRVSIVQRDVRPGKRAA